MTDPFAFELVVPHPDLVAAQRPGPADVAAAAGMLGWLPDADDRLRPAVPAGGAAIG